MERYISQRQYKRKIKRESSGSKSNQPVGYSTLDVKTEKRLSNGINDVKSTSTKLVSKTTYKLKKFENQDSDLDSAGEETKQEKSQLELMEVITIVCYCPELNHKHKDTY